MTTTYGQSVDAVLDHLEAAWLASLHVPGGLPDDLGYVVFKAQQTIDAHRGEGHMLGRLDEITRNPDQATLDFDAVVS